MERERVIEKIVEYFKENEDIFNDCIEELDSYNGYLGDDRYYSMDEFDDLYSGVEPSEVLIRAFYGHDEETFTTDAHGDRTYGAFNPNREYFTFNGYGNLVSADYKDYSAYLDEFAVEDMANNRQWIDTIGSDIELSELFDLLEEDETAAAQSAPLMQARTVATPCKYRAAERTRKAHKGGKVEAMANTLLSYFKDNLKAQGVDGVIEATVTKVLEGEKNG